MHCVADVDECESGDSVCPSNAYCTNLDGGYNCTCNQGYRFVENCFPNQFVNIFLRRNDASASLLHFVAKFFPTFLILFSKVAYGWLMRFITI